MCHERQSLVVTDISATLSCIDNIEREIDLNLKKAFSGHLVEQDPDDEPASVLLERIRAEKAAG